MKPLEVLFARCDLPVVDREQLGTTASRLDSLSRLFKLEPLDGLFVLPECLPQHTDGLLDGRRGSLGRTLGVEHSCATMSI